MTAEERKAYQRRYYEANKERLKAEARAYHHEHRDVRLAQGRAWYLANVDDQRRRGSERAKAWAIRNPDRAREKSRLTMRRRRAYSPEAVKSARRRDYEKNKTARLATVKAWRDRNGDRVHALAMKSKHRRRSRMQSVVVEHVDREQVFKRDGLICGICGRKVARKDASIDHINPIALGGAHTYANCQTAHLKCNLSKGARLMEKSA